MPGFWNGSRKGMYRMLAEVLGFSARHLRRLRDRYEADGAEGIVDRWLGHTPKAGGKVDQAGLTQLGKTGRLNPLGDATHG